jgi:hypothetical protein
MIMNLHYEFSIIPGYIRFVKLLKELMGNFPIFDVLQYDSQRGIITGVVVQMMYAKIGGIEVDDEGRRITLEFSQDIRLPLDERSWFGRHWCF